MLRMPKKGDCGLLDGCQMFSKSSRMDARAVGAPSAGAEGDAFGENMRNEAVYRGRQGV
jgi:hypothetical protein